MPVGRSSQPFENVLRNSSNEKGGRRGRLVDMSDDQRPYELDATDRRLLVELESDARVPVMELARRAGVARGTAQSRLDRMVAAGLISRLHIDPEVAGHPVLAFTKLTTTQADLDGLVAHLRSVREVLEVHTISGDGDVLCRIAARSNAHLQEVLATILGGPTIRHSTTDIVLTTPVALRTTQIAALD